jgi:hypothetical protein
MNPRRKVKKANSVTASNTDGHQLVEAAESFLAGCYEQFLRENDQIIPGWTRLNGVAHGDLDALKRMAKSLSFRDVPLIAGYSERAWGVAQALIAEEIVTMATDSPELLRRIQRRVLIPLEFHLMEEERVTALELVVLIRELVKP